MESPWDDLDRTFPVLGRSVEREAIVALDGGAATFETAPTWLRRALGEGPRQTRTLAARDRAGHALAPLAWLAESAMRLDAPLRDYLVETEGENGAALLLHATPLGSGRVRIEAEDVSDIVRERRRAAAVGAFHGLVGQSLPMLEVYHRIAMYGPTEAPVIITGETGTGKELVARALHERSPRAQGPLVPVNCSALTPDLFESELFGHEKGSFTGAHRQHRGRFERADGGTLFLDEIGDMPAMTQSKLLRALEEGVIERVGSEQEHRVDVRVIAATNVALEYAVASGRFRADLYHRLSVLRVHMPPLRERLGDIPALVESMLEGFNRRYRKSIRRVTPEALRLLQDYAWPGNVRELRNVIERLVVETESEAIGANALGRWVREREYLLPGAWNLEHAYPPRHPMHDGQGWAPPAPAAVPRYGGEHWGAGSVMAFPTGTPGPALIEAQAHREEADTADRDPVELTEQAIRAAFQAARGNATRAAADLGVHKATLYRHIKRLGLTRESLEAAEEGEG